MLLGIVQYLSDDLREPLLALSRKPLIILLDALLNVLGQPFGCVLSEVTPAGLRFGSYAMIEGERSESLWLLRAC